MPNKRVKLNLIDAMSCEYRRGKKWWNSGLYLKCILLLTSIVAVYATGRIIMIVGFATLIIPIAALLVNLKASGHYSRAEKMRRLLLLIDGLGIEAPKLELAQLEFEIGKFDKAKPLYTPPYYDSPLSAGPQRLSDIIAESAFFTKNLSESSAKLFGGIAFIGVLLIASFMYFLIQSNISQTAGQLSAKIITMMIVFFVAGDFVLYCLKFSELSKTSENVLVKCDKLRNGQDINIQDVISIMDDYNCALIKSPPIPDFIYKMKLNTLNEAWRNHRK